MDRRQNNGERCRIVQRYILNLTDDRSRIACFIYMRKGDDFDVRNQLGITYRELELLKLTMAIGLRKCGIRI